MIVKRITDMTKITDMTIRATDIIKMIIRGVTDIKRATKLDIINLQEITISIVPAKNAKEKDIIINFLKI
uniref:Uncharacterized protein n=1 Tax=Pithovirus LCDPAC02 TaxID=2506601 RepID=A0A481YNP2_9VIRU|nr:MAG: hypothetical protein LCDPAC02_00870 [Pithovirus LCDPAC02]